MSSFSDVLLLPEYVPLDQILRKTYFKPQILCLAKPSTEAGLSGHAPGTYFQLGPTSCFPPSSSTVIKLRICQWIKHSLCQSLLDTIVHFPKACHLQPVKPFSEWVVETESTAVLLSLVYHPAQLVHSLTNASWHWWPICSPNLKISSNVCMFMCSFQNTLTQMILFPFCWTMLERFWLICSRSLSHSEWSWLCLLYSETCFGSVVSLNMELCVTSLFNEGLFYELEK